MNQQQIEHPRLGPTVRRHNSKQDYETPIEFIRVVESRFGRIKVDLAATEKDAKADRYITQEQDSLSQHWHHRFGSLFLWLNPPFNNVAPWVEKCLLESQKGARILLLTQASVGSNWFAEYIFGHANIYFLRPRLSFDGENPYPKDLMLSAFAPEIANPRIQCWKWK